MPIRVLIAESDVEKRNQIREFVGPMEDYEVVALARDGQEAVQLAIQREANIGFISFDLKGMSGLETVEILRSLAPDTVCALTTDFVTQERTDAAMSSGARMLTTLSDAEESYRVATLLASIWARQSKRPELEWNPQVISVTGAKGGVGKTTISVNLAVTLAETHPEKVVLLDLYTQFGDVATMLGLMPGRTIAHIASDSDELDPDLLESCIVKHPLGMHVLVTSTDPLPLDAISADYLDNLLYMLRRKYRYILVDVPPFLNEATLHVLAHSNVILLIANLFDLTTAADTKKLYMALQREYITRENIKIVLNRISRGKVNKLSISDIEKMFDCGIAGYIPNDSKQVDRINKGEPLRNGDSRLGRSMLDLARAIADTSNVSMAKSKQPTDRTGFMSRGTSSADCR